MDSTQEKNCFENYLVRKLFSFESYFGSKTILVSKTIQCENYLVSKAILVRKLFVSKTIVAKEKGKNENSYCDSAVYNIELLVLKLSKIQFDPKYYSTRVNGEISSLRTEIYSERRILVIFKVTIVSQHWPFGIAVISSPQYVSLKLSLCVSRKIERSFVLLSGNNQF